MEVLNKFLATVVTQIVNPLILLMSGAAFIVFVWGIFTFIKDSGDAEKRQEGRHAIMWGLVGLVIIFGAYGIINIALSTFNIAPVKPLSH